jgi:hypothetical protein
MADEGYNILLTDANMTKDYKYVRQSDYLSVIIYTFVINIVYGK